MLIALATPYLAVRGVQALSTTAISSTTLHLSHVTVDPRASTTCNDLGQCRTFWNIIWGCLATIVLCTWVSIHPNIPGRDEGRIAIVARRIGLVVLALIAPELIIAWAMREWLASRRLARVHEGQFVEFLSLNWLKQISCLV